MAALIPRAPAGEPRTARRFGGSPIYRPVRDVPRSAQLETASTAHAKDAASPNSQLPSDYFSFSSGYVPSPFIHAFTSAWASCGAFSENSSDELEEADLKPLAQPSHSDTEASLESTLPLPLKSDIAEQTEETRQRIGHGVIDTLNKKMSPSPQNSDVARWVEEDRQDSASASASEGEALKKKFFDEEARKARLFCEGEALKARKKALLRRLPAIQFTSQSSTPDPLSARSVGDPLPSHEALAVSNPLSARSDMQSSGNLPVSHLRVHTDPELPLINPLINPLNHPGGNLRVNTDPELPRYQENPSLELPEHIQEDMVALEEPRPVVKRPTRLDRIAHLPGAIVRRVHSNRSQTRVARFTRRITL